MRACQEGGHNRKIGETAGGSGMKSKQSHPHGGPDRESSRKSLTAILVLSGTYRVAEIVGGLLTNSLALLADAGHMFSDVAALGLALFALWFVRKSPTNRHTYGFYRSEILAALANGASLVAVSIDIFVEAYERLREPPGSDRICHRASETRYSARSRSPAPTERVPANFVMPPLASSQGILYTYR